MSQMAVEKKKSMTPEERSEEGLRILAKIIARELSRESEARTVELNTVCPGSRSLNSQGALNQR